jgi:hypothetical protein
MISINLYESSDGLLVDEIVPEKKESEKLKAQMMINEPQLQLITVDSIRNDRPPINIPTQALFPII